MRDTSIGIPEDEITHIFERFYRGSQAREMKNDGSGLGLAIAKGMINSHGGRLLVSSSPGEGSCFTAIFTLKETKTHRFFTG